MNGMTDTRYRGRERSRREEKLEKIRSNTDGSCSEKVISLSCNVSKQREITRVEVMQSDYSVTFLSPI